MRHICIALTVALAPLCACGADPAVQFVGTWTGPESITLTTDAGQSLTVAVGTVTETLTEDVRDGHVDFSECGLTGTPEGSTLEVAAASAPCLANQPSSTACGVTLAVASGTAVVRGNAMSIDLQGSASSFACPSGSGFTASFSLHADTTRT